MHNYHDVQQSFPWGFRGADKNTWAIQVFSFIEKNQISSQYDWKIDYHEGINRTLLENLVIPTYTCPSDGNNNKYYDDPIDRRHNYVVCMGRDGVFDPWYPRPLPTYNPQNCLIDGVVYGRESQYRAMFFGSCYDTVWEYPAYPLTTTFADVIDGTSNTVALSETIQGSPADCRGCIWYGENSFFNTNQVPNTMVEDISSWTDETEYGHRHPLRLAITDESNPEGHYLRYSARSWHVGGVNAGLADGSVRFIQNQINLDIWRAAGSTNGGEVGSLH
jgi:hypothetical protein